MKALSLQQPYADLIVERYYEDDPHRVLKPVENRAWSLPSTLILPARIYVHASLGFYPVKMAEIKDIMTASQWLRLKDRLHAIYGAWDCYRNDPAFRQRLGYFGCLIGEVTITGCVKKVDDSISLIGDFWPKAEESYESPWFFGPYGYTLTDPVRYNKGIPCKGHLGFFEPGNVSV